MEQSVLFKMKRARAAMIQSQRFFGYLASTLELREDNRFKTLAVNNKYLFYNSAYVDSLPMPKLIGGVAHEACHIAHCDHTRRKGRDKKKWNEATDFRINLILKDAGFDLPDGALLDERFRGMSAEQVYYVREKEAQQGGGGGQGQQPQPQQGQPGGGGEGEDQQPGDQEAPGIPEGGVGDTGGCGEVLDAVDEDGDKATPGELAQAEADVQIKVAMAHRFAKTAGQGSEDQDRILKHVKEVQVDWVEELQRFMQAVAKDEYDWCRPNRRLVSQGIYMPSLHSQRMGPMVVAIDASGSTMDWLDEFAAQLTPIIEDLKPEKIYVAWTTDKVVHVDEFTPDEWPGTITGHGIGGTDFRPLFQWIEENDIDPHCVVYLTDLYGEAPKEEPAYPVLWACCTDEQQPWGDRIQLKR